ncbi:hypothetical protein CF319_g8246 [Tilletia indica]|nr:hypothetical protein CF319_g8246 [Tilletia indica]
MPPIRSGSIRAGQDKATGKFWCDCTVQGCRTPTRQLNEVARRTYYAHKKQQELAVSRARNASKPVLTPTQPQAESSAQAAQHSDQFQGSAASFDFGDDGNGDFFNDPLPPSGDRSSSSSSSSSSSDSDDSEDDAGWGFGDGVEPERVLDVDRPVFGNEDNDGPEGGGSDAVGGSRSSRGGGDSDSTPASRTASVYKDISRKFMILVVSLTAFFGLGRQGADMLLAFFGSIIQPLLDDPGPTIPRQIGTVRQHLGLDPPLVRYAVCPACEELSLVSPTSDETTQCPHCSEHLYERKGKPKVMFVYQPLTAWLEWLLHQPGVEDALQEWRERDPCADLMDIYDGAAWSDERDRNNRRFVDHSYSLLVALGIDWFSPFRSQYTSWHSTGAIMMTILNFPQRLRYHPSMTYLSGCTPGPKEPVATRLHCYLRPLLDELAELADGKYISTLTKPNKQLVRLRIAFFCGDSVGRNKVCGFPSHSVRKGQYCGFCEVTIPTTIDAFENGAADLERCPRQHKSDSVRLDQPFRTKKAKTLYERDTGARHSPLNRLSYWLSVDRAPVDHMHNVELGLVKRLFHRTLIEGKSISAIHLKRLQSSLLTAQVPPSEQAPDWRLGDPGGGSATAAQWSTLGRRLFVLLLYVSWKPIIDSDEVVAFEPPSSKAEATAIAKAVVEAAAQVDDEQEELLNENNAGQEDAGQEDAGQENNDGADEGDEAQGDNDGAESVQSTNNSGSKRVKARDVLRHAAVLASAASLCARRRISVEEINDLDTLLRDYGRSTAKLFGNKWVTYNTHIAMHIPAHIRRFGPPYHFSAYHFERMNGQLGKVQTNRHRNGEVEATYTKAFLTNARSGLLLADNAESIGTALQNRAPAFQPPQGLRLSQLSVVGSSGSVDLELSDGLPFHLPLRFHGQLYRHIKRTWNDTLPPLLSPSSSQSNGIRVLPSMKQHQNMKFGHLNFSSTGSRANANRSRTYAAVDGPSASLDLFKIEAILSHSVHVRSDKHETLYILGRRSRRAQVPGFGAVLSEALLQRTLKLFWTQKDSWGGMELVPAHELSSDAAFVHGPGITGVSPGEDQRHII